MNWSTSLLQSIRLWAGTGFIKQFSQPQPCPDLETMPNITVAIIDTFYQLVEHGTPIEQPPLVFASIPGLSVHPLKFSLVLIGLLMITSFATLCLGIHRVYKSHYDMLVQELSHTNTELTVCHQKAQRKAANKIGAFLSHVMTTQEARLDRVRTENVQLQTMYREHIRELESEKAIIESVTEKLHKDNSWLNQEVMELSSLSDQMKTLQEENVSLRQVLAYTKNARMRLIVNKISTEATSDAEIELRTTLQNKVAQLGIENGDLVLEQTALKHELTNVETKIQILIHDNSKLTERLEQTIKYNSTLTNDLAVKEKQLRTTNDNTIMLKAENAKVKDEAARLAGQATKLNREDKKLKEQNIKLVEENKTLTRAYLQSVAKEQKLWEQHSVTKDQLRDAIDSAERSNDQALEFEGRLLTKDCEIMAVQAQLAKARFESKSLNAQLAAEKKEYQDQRSKRAESANALKQIAIALGVDSPYTRIVASPHETNTTKSTPTRDHTIEQIFNHGAGIFRATNGVRGRGHSVNYGDTRLEIAKELRGEAIQLLRPEEKAILAFQNDTSQVSSRASMDVTRRKGVTSSIEPGTNINHQCVSLASLNLASALPAVNNNNYESIVSADRRTSLSLWSPITQYDINSLLAHKFQMTLQERTDEERDSSTHN